MRQLELFGTDELKPVRVYITAWTEEQRIKNLAPGRLGEPAEAREGSVEKKEPPK